MRVLSWVWKAVSKSEVMRVPFQNGEILKSADETASLMNSCPRGEFQPSSRFGKPSFFVRVRIASGRMPFIASRKIRWVPCANFMRGRNREGEGNQPPVHERRADFNTVRHRK